MSPAFNLREVTVLREALKVFAASFLAVMRSLVNFSRMYGSRGMAPLKRSRGGQAIAPKGNGPSARGRAGAVEVVFRGAQKHRQSIQRIALGPKTPIRVSTSHRDRLPSFGRLYTLSAGGFDHCAAECENLTVNCRRAQVRSLGGSRSLLDQTRETGLAFALLVTLGLAAG